MPAQDDMREAMLAAVPNLRAFAVSLCGDMDRANDLVQETLLRAWAHQDSFEPGTNMSAWLFTILRNHFRTEYRKRRREVEDADGPRQPFVLLCAKRFLAIHQTEDRLVASWIAGL